MKISNKPGRMIKLFSAFLGLVLCLVLILYWMKHPAESTWLGETFFLEERMPGFWDQLNVTKAVIKPVPEDEEILSVRKNLIVNTLSVIQGNGYTIRTNRDGSITFSGKNEAGNRVYHSFCNGRSGLFLPDGEYIFTDGRVSENPEIYIYIEGQSYEIGGQPMNQELANLVWGDKSGRFTTDQKQFYRYNCVLTIGAGFSAEELTFYPMIRSADDPDGQYEPCSIPNYPFDSNAEPMSYYQRYRADLEGLTRLSVLDWKVLDRTLNAYSQKYKWMTFDFSNGTGIQITGSAIGKAMYGYLDPYGRVNNPVEVIDLSEDGSIGKLADKLRNEVPLQKITRFDSYLLELITNQYTVFISVREEGTRALSNVQKDLLEELGCQTDFTGKYGYSYLAVLDNGKVVEERCNDEALEVTGKLRDGPEYQIISQGSRVGNYSSINLDGVEYSMNRRGMNFVVWDPIEQRVVDTVVFDTYSGLSDYRVNDGLIGASE